LDDVLALLAVALDEVEKALFKRREGCRESWACP
jgi:hypothetical protein